MHKFFEQCVETYVDLTKATMEKVDTPFIDEDKGIINPARTEQAGPGFICPGCAEAFPKAAFQEVLDRQEAEKYARKSD